MVKLTSWGRLTQTDQRLVPLSNKSAVSDLIARTGPGIVFGNGRSYGDICLNPGGTVWDARYLDHFISFDEVSGRLVCESGVLLRDIHRLVVPRGWILPVTPGTQLITVGGAIANDVHGKNHHICGTFGEHVRRIKLARTDGENLDISRESNPEWLEATIAGMGLTGVIVEVELQLRKISTAVLETETLNYNNIQEFMTLADESEADWEHTVSWVDCSTRNHGRGIFLRGRMGAGQDLDFPSVKERTMPFVPPVSLINRFSIGPMSASYFWLQKKKKGLHEQHFQEFLYPLDNIREWNRCYGPRGFYQYQCVLPRESGVDALNSMLAIISQSGSGSFLSVLKTFSDRPAAGMLSFPMEGITLALDFPNKGGSTLKLLDDLDKVTTEARGRVYLAKDARLSETSFAQSYPRVQEFMKFRDEGISSSMSRRLMGN